MLLGRSHLGDQDLLYLRCDPHTVFLILNLCWGRGRSHDPGGWEHGCRNESESECRSQMEFQDLIDLDIFGEGFKAVLNLFLGLSARIGGEHYGGLSCDTTHIELPSYPLMFLVTVRLGNHGWLGIGCSQ